MLTCGQLIIFFFTMYRHVIFYINTIKALLVITLWVDFSPCYSIQTCGDCIKIPSTLWCGNPKSKNTARCFIPGFGPEKKWISSCNDVSSVFKAPAAFSETVQDVPFSSPDDNDIDNVVQIKPQKVKLGLPVGGTENVLMRFKYVSDYSLGLYYLMDLSKSMDVDRKTILSLADSLVSELQKLTPYFKLGFGTFLDKVKLPYVNTHREWLNNPCIVENECRRPYGFQNILSLTNDTNAFINSVEKAKISTNWDNPEGGLDALMQVMVCDNVGWEKKKTRHLIVYVSDSAFKYAGDGKLAGLTTDNDMKCHLNDDGLYTYSSVQDYPSVSQIEKVSNLENMYIIFAVKKKVIALYEALTDLVTQSEASLLLEDSSNIIEIITNYYRDISKSLRMETSSENPSYVDVTFRAKCGENQNWKEGSAQCEDVDVNKEIQFDVKFKLKKCPDDGKPILIHISPEGLQDEMVVEIEPLCECPCKTDAVVNAKECNGNGTLECGVCLCNAGFSGEYCQCRPTGPSIDGAVSRSCRAANDSSGKDCNGRGSCICDKCQCKENIDGHSHWKFQGEFCEFSNFDCPRNKGGICSKRGLCEYSECICEEGWTEDDCSCDLATNGCVYSDSVYDKLCNDHGDCTCNQCSCHETVEGSGDYFFGQFCEDCQNCTGLCDTYELIVRQQSLTNNVSVLVNEVDELSVAPSMKICRLKKENGCSVRFSYDPRVENVIFVEVESCPANVLATQNLLMVIIAGIVVLGVISLLLWKLWVTQKDKREYEKFLKETKEATFSRIENPLYRDPVTRITNPLHVQNETRKDL